MPGFKLSLNTRMAELVSRRQNVFVGRVAAAFVTSAFSAFEGPNNSWMQTRKLTAQPPNDANGRYACVVRLHSQKCFSLSEISFNTQTRPYMMDMCAQVRHPGQMMPSDRTHPVKGPRRGKEHFVVRYRASDFRSGTFEPELGHQGM
jgi:hypothetical protein